MSERPIHRSYDSPSERLTTEEMNRAVSAVLAESVKSRGLYLTTGEAKKMVEAVVDAIGELP
jgi:hypothetical protein